MAERPRRWHAGGDSVSAPAAEQSGILEPLVSMGMLAPGNGNELFDSVTPAATRYVLALAARR
jgi:hypothetical protein